MTYVERNLLAGEHVEHVGTVSPWSLAPQIVLGLLLMPFFGLGLFFWAAAAIRFITTESAITNRRIMAKCGLIGRNTIELNLRRAESIRIDQGVLGRVFDFGSIIVSGAGNPQAPIPGIGDPLTFRRKFLEIQEAAENRAALLPRSEK